MKTKILISRRCCLHFLISHYIFWLFRVPREQSGSYLRKLHWDGSVTPIYPPTYRQKFACSPKTVHCVQLQLTVLNTVFESQHSWDKFCAVLASGSLGFTWTLNMIYFSEPQIMPSLSASSAMTAVMLSKFFPVITMTGVIEVNQPLR